MVDSYVEGTRFGLLTVRAQQNEVDVFEDTMKLILPIINTYPSFIYTVEDDNTPNRHIHCFLQNPSKAKEVDSSKLFQKFNKVKKDLSKYIKLKQTKEKPFWDQKLIGDSPEDFFKVLGYIQKDTLVSRRRVKNITSEVLRQGSDFYATTAKISKSCNKNDWTAVKPQNAHSLISHFSEKHNIDVIDTELIPAMVADKHGFNQITSPQLKLTLTELKYQKYRNDTLKEEILAHAGDYRKQNEFDERESQRDYLCQVLLERLPFSERENLPKAALGVIELLYEQYG